MSNTLSMSEYLMSQNETAGERVKRRRLELNLSQEELAKKTGYKSRSSINKIELSRDIPLDKARTLAEALEVTPEYLLGWDETLDYTNEEKELINLYRKADEYDRKTVYRILSKDKK